MGDENSWRFRRGRKKGWGEMGRGGTEETRRKGITEIGDGTKDFPDQEVDSRRGFFLFPFPALKPGVFSRISKSRQG